MMITALNWQLAIAYSLHFFATVIWLGGLVVACLALHPAWLRGEPTAAALQHAAQWYRRFLPIAGISSCTLLVSGLLQMSSSPHYEGLLQIVGLWGWVMLVKHLLYGVVVAVALYSGFFWQPNWQRAYLRAVQTHTLPQARQVLAQQIWLDRFTLVCCALILICSALARIA